MIYCHCKDAEYYEDGYFLYYDIEKLEEIFNTQMERVNMSMPVIKEKIPNNKDVEKISSALTNFNEEYSGIFHDKELDSMLIENINNKISYIISTLDSLEIQHNKDQAIYDLNELSDAFGVMYRIINELVERKGTINPEM